MSAAPRRLARGLLLLLLPALVIVAAEYHRAARGSFFSGPNQDPSYTYLLGSLQLIRYGTTAFYHHPGLPTQGLGAAVLAVVHRVAGRQDDLTRDVFARPELYLRAIQLTMLAAVVSALTTMGFLVRRRGDSVAALLLQTSPFLGATSLVALSQVSPESTLMLATVALSLAVWHFATTAPGDERAVAVVFGAIAAFAFTTRISALPFVIVPPLLLASWRGRAFFAATVAAGSGLMLLLIGRWQAFFNWVLLMGRRTGPWGSKPRSVLDPDLYVEGLALIFRRHHAFFAVLALALVVWLWHRGRRHDAGALEPFHRALGAVLLGQAVQVLLVSKNPAGRYLVPATALAGLDLALAWTLTREHRRASLLTGGTGWARDRRLVVVAALLLVLLVALELPRHRAELNRLRQGVLDQRVIAAEIALLGADCAVAEFNRASSLPFALYFGRRVRPGILAEELTDLYPQELFYNVRRRRFENFAGPIPAAEVTRKHSCLALHGNFRADLAPLVIRRTRMETLYAVSSLDAVVDPETTESD